MLLIEATKITEIMEKLNDLPYQKILFNGAWGIGKTKHIIDSIKNKENIHYISLFGKKDINAFYQELYYLLLSKHKVNFQKVLNNIKEVNLSQFGINISIPLISDIFISIQKQLNIKSNITIIIDDLERKNDDFDMKEIFGFVDSITNNDGIKVILVASSENFSSQEKITFEEYAEKAIDRIYTINSYSVDAPKKIMDDNIWPVIKGIYLEGEFRNLRTLKKTNLFIKEVMTEIPSDVFTNKFNKEDIYKICFSVVLFVIEDKCKMKLLPEKDEVNVGEFFDTYNSQENFSNYIWHYILKQNLNNSMMYNLIPIILDCFLTGNFSKVQFNEIVKLVNTYVDSTSPLFMSDQQIIKEINDFPTFLKNVDQSTSIVGFLKRLDELARIAEKTNMDVNYNMDEIVNWLIDKNDFNNKYDTGYFDTFIERKSNFVNKVISNLQITVKNHSRDNILKVMVENTNKRDFTQNEIDEIVEFKKFVITLKNEKEDKQKKHVIKEMKSNKWFLPLPLGEISYSHWTYCHYVFKLIMEIGSWEENSFVDEAREYYRQEIENYSDKVFEYRLQSLIKQYL